MNPPWRTICPGSPLRAGHTAATYTLDVAVRLGGVASQTVRYYLEQGLSAPVASRFNAVALRTPRRIKHLRSIRAANVSGFKLILDLMDEVELLRAEPRARR